MQAAKLARPALSRARRTASDRAGSSPPRRPGSTRLLRPDATAGEAFRVIALACFERFEFNAARLARSGDAETLHQARVALRQLRSAFSIFGEVVQDQRFDMLRRGLRWLSASLNEARDLDVLIARFDAPQASLVEARRRAYEQAAAALGSARTRQIERTLAEWLEPGEPNPAEGCAEPSAAAFATASLDRLRRKLRKRGRHLREQDDAQLHELRIAAKKLRYASEFFAGLFGQGEARRRDEPIVQALRALQDQLGEVQDRAIAPALLERFEVPKARWPKLSGRKRLIKRADAQFDRVLEAERFWR